MQAPSLHYYYKTIKYFTLYKCKLSINASLIWPYGPVGAVLREIPLYDAEETPLHGRLGLSITTTATGSKARKPKTRTDLKVQPIQIKRTC